MLVKSELQWAIFHASIVSATPPVKLIVRPSGNKYGSDLMMTSQNVSLSEAQRESSDHD
jgi:hypothetical protein